MNGIFNVDNGFFSIMGKLWDMVMLSIIWLVCCIPLVTIGPATAALYYTIVKVIRRERGYITKEFFHSFKDNLKVGIITNLVFGLIGYILFLDFSLSRSLQEAGEYYADLVYAVFVAITTLVVFVFIFLYPILSRFTLTARGVFKTSIIIAMKHFPTTIVLAIIFAFSVLLIYTIYPLIFIVPALCSLTCSFLIERVLKKYMPKPEETTEEVGRDLWYWE